MSAQNDLFIDHPAGAGYDQADRRKFYPPGVRTSFTASPKWMSSDLKINHEVQVSIEHVPKYYNHVYEASGSNMIRWQGDATSFTVANTDVETRPVNMALNFMMKISDSFIDSRMPPGSILPFAGDDEESAPETWLPCNGGMYSQTQLLSLSNFIGTRFTNPNNTLSGYFSVPDLRGLFIRGVNFNSSFSDTAGDPDWNSDAIPQPTGRELAPDMQTRHPTLVGTLQYPAISFRNWQVNIPHFPQQSTVGAKSVAGNKNLESSNWQSAQKWTGFGVETRPSNAAVRYIISGLGAGATDVPIGSIIASVVDLPDEQRLGWLRCDGSTVPAADYPDLFRVLNGAWGSVVPASSNFMTHILLPNLDGGTFLRGTDLRPADQLLENNHLVDPERENRARIASKANLLDPNVLIPNARGTGTTQSFSTGIPKQWVLTQQFPNDRVIGQDVNAQDVSQRSTWFVEMQPDVKFGVPNMGLAASIPNKIGNNAKTIGGSGPAAEWYDNATQFHITTADEKTKPKSVSVVFYVKAKHSY